MNSANISNLFLKNLSYCTVKLKSPPKKNIPPPTKKNNSELNTPLPKKIHHFNNS